MKTTLLLTFLITITFVRSQDSLYSKVYYQDNENIEVSSMARYFDNGFIISGLYQNSKGFISRKDSLGNEIWTKQLNNIENNWDNIKFNEIIPTTDSCFLLAGTIRNINTNFFDLYCIKIDTLGETLWTRSYGVINGINYGYNRNVAVVESQDSTYTLAWSDNQQNVFIASMDLSGNLIWSTILDQSVTIKKIQQLPDHSYMITGNKFNTTDGYYDGISIIISETGQYIESKKYVHFCITDHLVSNDGIYILGKLDGSYSIILSKIDFSGGLLWSNLYPEQFFSLLDDQLKLIQLSDSSLLLMVSSQDESQLIKVDSNGTVIDNKALSVYANSMTETKNGGMFIAGNGPLLGLSPSVNYYHFGVLRLDSLADGDYCSFDLGFPEVFNGSVTIEPFVFSSGGDLIENVIPITIESYSYLSEIGCVLRGWGIQESDFVQQIKVYPNSSNGIFTFDQTDSREIQLFIYNSFGQEIGHKTSCEISTTIDLSNHPNGIYFYKIIDSNDGSVTGKLIIQK